MRVALASISTVLGLADTAAHCRWMGLGKRNRDAWDGNRLVREAGLTQKRLVRAQYQGNVDARRGDGRLTRQVEQIAVLAVA